MASSNITGLTNLTTPTPTMLLYAALSPFGVTDDRKITADNLFSVITANVTGSPNITASNVSAGDQVLWVKESAAGALIKVDNFPSLLGFQVATEASYWMFSFVNEAAPYRWGVFSDDTLGEFQFQGHTSAPAFTGGGSFSPLGGVGVFSASSNDTGYLFKNSANVYSLGIAAAGGGASVATTEITFTTTGVGVNKPTSIGAQLHVVSGSASRITGIIASAASPSVDIFDVRQNATNVFQITLSGALIHTTTARTSGVASYHQTITPADTGLTASTESIGIQLGGNSSAATVTRTWATGALTTQRECVFVAPTYAFAGASTITTAATVAITGAPVAGTNATITNAFALDVTGATRITGKLTVTGAIDPTSLSLSGGTALYFESANGNTAAVSASNEGRIRYNSSTQTWQASMNGAAYADIATGSVTTSWNAITNPTGNQALTMGSGATNYTSTWTWGTATTGNMFTLTTGTNDTAGGGTSWLVSIEAPGASNAKRPIRVIAAGSTAMEILANGSMVNLGAGANSQRIGSNSTAGGSEALAYGNSSTAAATQSTAIGNGLSIGSGATNATGVGYAGTLNAADTTGLGRGFLADGTRGIAMGVGAQARATDTLSIGNSVTNNVANQAVIGSSTSQYTAWYIGSGVTMASPTSITLNATGGSGTDNAGASMTIAGGKGTGTGNGGSLILQIAPPAASTGSSANTLATVATFNTFGALSLSPQARRSGSPTYFQIITPADVTLAADTEAIGSQFGGNSSAATVTRQFTAGGGAFATQRENVFIAPTYGMSSADTITTAFTLAVSAAPIAGTNTTITNPYAFGVQSGEAYIQGMLKVGGAVTLPTRQLELTSANTGRVALYVTGANAATVDLVQWVNVADDTSTVANLATFDTSSDGTAANGFGASFTFQLESSTTGSRTAAVLQWLWSDATDATRTADLVFQNVNSGTVAETFRITGNGLPVWPNTVTAGGTTGNQTINKPSGTVNIAAAGTTVTVTNSLVTTSSIVFAVIRTNDSTATIKNVVPGSGSFVITLTAAATGEVSIGFFVINK